MTTKNNFTYMCKYKMSRETYKTRIKTKLK